MTSTPWAPPAEQSLHPLPATADRVAVVFGAKGGVGASAVALAIARDLAHGLARATGTHDGVGVLAIDAHPGRSDLALLAADGPTPGLALTSAAKLGAPPHTGDSAAHAAKKLLRAARLWTDDNGGWIVIDAGVGDSPWAIELALRAQRPLLVTTPDRLSILNAYAALKRLGGGAARVALIVNHAADPAAAAAAHATIAASCRRFLAGSPSLAGWLPTTSDDPTTVTIAAAA